MSGMTVLVSPLNWGFGHAGRMIPVALELKRRGCEVIFAADTSLLTMAGRELPGVRLAEIPGLRIRYSRFLPQYICIFLQLPRIIASGFKEHRHLRRLVREINPSIIISDNRFGFYHREVYSVYVTHQLRIPFPGMLRFIEPLAAWLHRLIINRFDICLVPDFPGDENLSGRLSHGVRLPRNMMYIGSLSRFAGAEGSEVAASYTAVESGMTVSPSGPGTGDSLWHRSREEASGSSGNPYVCLILSGPEPQRTLLLEEAARALRDIETVILSTSPAPHTFGRKHPEVTFVAAPDRETIRSIIASSSLVIARAGYTSVMELFSMNRGAVIIPTPGQTEQEYIGKYLDGKYGFITIKQDQIEKLQQIVTDVADFATVGPGDGIRHGMARPGADSSFAKALFEKAIDYLLEQKKK